jgi:acyl-CoA synthetase (AMP-forming)/AMP-acid ligase II
MMNASHFTLYDMLRRNAASSANRVAVFHDQGQLTFGELLHRVDAMATGLAGMGIGKGERICILAQNHLSYLELYGACAKLGLLAYPINWRLTAEEVHRIVERAEPCMMIIDDTTGELVASERANNHSVPHWYIFGETPIEGFEAFDTVYDTSSPTVSEQSTPDDAFAVISTAAVDVIPRGALLTQNNIIAANLQSMAVMGLCDTDCNLLALPLFHVAALGSCFATMHAGGANVLMNHFDTEAAVRSIEAHQVTYLTSFPPVLSSILDQAAERYVSLASLRHVAGLEAPDTIQRLHDTTSAHFWSGFGQTETSGFVTIQRAIDKPGAAGKPGPLCRVKLVDDYDRDVPTGTPGEILVRGPMVFQGYFRLDEVTAHTFRNGWHHTGDVGRFDDEGYLYYVKRKAEKELIKPGGENVYPAEVESVIMEIDGVTGVCVFGVSDPQWGEAIKAVVETASDASLTAERVIAHVGSRIARFKRPRHVAFTASLPTTDDGLVDRDAVKAAWGETS